MRRFRRLINGDGSSEHNPPIPMQYKPLPPSLKSQFEDIFNAIVKTKKTLKEISAIIALFAVSVGYKTDFRPNFFTYSKYVAGRPKSISFEKGLDFQNEILDFSFTGRCKVRFIILKKSDEMWLGVVGDLGYLDERHSLTRGAAGKWALYCGRTSDEYHCAVDDKMISRDKMLASFKPKLNVEGLSVGQYGSFHFPRRCVHKLVPVNTGDIVDMEVDAQEKSFTVVVNNEVQACSKAEDMPGKLVFFVQLDYTDDEVEFELLDFGFKKKFERKSKINKCVEYKTLINE